MSVKVMSAVWEQSLAKGGTLLTLLAIADSANDDGVAWPGQDHLARKTRMSRRGVQFNISKLRRMGELEVEDRPGRSCVYTVRVRKDFAPTHVENFAGGAKPTSYPGAKPTSQGCEAHFAHTHQDPSIDPPTEPSAERTAANAFIEKAREAQALSEGVM